MPNECTRRTALALMGALPAAVSQSLSAQPERAPQQSGTAQVVVNEKSSPPEPYDLLMMPGDRIITEEEHFGIINGLLTAGVNYRDVGTLNGLYAPPYASSDFLLELRLFGEKVPTRRHDWRPIEVRREGELYGIAVSTSTMLVSGMRAGLLTLTFHNTAAKTQPVPVQFSITGGFDNVKYWGFPRPDTTKSKTILWTISRKFLTKLKLKWLPRSRRLGSKA